MIIIKKFVEIINVHQFAPDIKTEDGEKRVYGPFWIKWIGERFEDFLLTHNEEILPYIDEFRKEVINSETQKYVTRTFKMFASFKL